MGYYGMGYGIDPTYILVIIGAVITMIASARMKGTFSKYAQIRSASGLTGREVAERILNANGIYDVAVQPVSGQLTDHYDPSKKTVNLSEVIYNDTSVAALGVAAHECGHAIQDHLGYFPLRFRSAFVPLATIGSNLSWPMIIIGLILSQSSRSGGNIGYSIATIGCFLFSLAVLFQIITLPVEYNASHRALIQLKETNTLSPAEEGEARSVLHAAALTYVAAAASSVLQLLRIMLILNGNRRRDD